MVRYAILLSQGHNRVYFEASKKLSLTEMEIVSQAFSVQCVNISIREIKGIFYMVFDTVEYLEAGDLCLLSGLSFAYALFETREVGGEVLLYPIRKDALHYFDDDISMILRYTGKTNEIFTKMLINIAVCSSDYCGADKINLLDPVAGKGTTLFEGLICGYDCYGIEISPDAVHDGVIYFKKYLETAKYKHTFQQNRFSGENKCFMVQMNNFTVAGSKADFKSGNVQNFNFISGDSRYADKFLKNDFFHIIVGDLPYGVQHGSVSGQKQSSFTRNPSELLKACLPGWIRCLKSGGTIALAWNKFVISREAVESLLEDHGMTVLDSSPYNQFEHRVDQSINRDVIVAKKILKKCI